MNGAKKVVQCFQFIEVTLPDDGGGSIVSDLHDLDEADNSPYNSAIDALEALVLAQACTGIDITSKEYGEAIEIALNAICEHIY
jgi:hypothetical protein